MKIGTVFNKIKDIAEIVFRKKLSIFVISLVALILLFGIFWNIRSYIGIKTISTIPNISDLAGEKNSGADALTMVGALRYAKNAACPTVTGSTIRAVLFWDGGIMNAQSNCASGRTCVCYYSSN
ncbi:MAG: hypothetical protein WC523_07275 [Patescibacteria group bacterium]